MKQEIHRCEYGCEVKPVLAALEAAFPSYRFEVFGTYSVEVNTHDVISARDFDIMYAIAKSAVAAFHQGYRAGMADTAKEYLRAGHEL